MNWTTEKPTVPGTYWYRSASHSMPYIAVILYAADDMNDAEAHFIGGYHQFLGRLPGEWYGPLEIPKRARSRTLTPQEDAP